MLESEPWRWSRISGQLITADYSKYRKHQESGRKSLCFPREVHDEISIFGHKVIRKGDEMFFLRLKRRLVPNSYHSLEWENIPVEVSLFRPFYGSILVGSL